MLRVFVLHFLEKSAQKPSFISSFLKFLYIAGFWALFSKKCKLTPQPLNNGGPALAAKPPLTQSVKRTRNEEPAFTRSVKIEPESITKSAIFPTMKRRTRKNRKNRKSRKSRKNL